MVASHILIRSVSRVYENTYLLMCLFLLAVEIPLTNKTPLVFQGQPAGFDLDIVYCFFHSFFARPFFFFLLRAIYDCKP